MGRSGWKRSGGWRAGVVLGWLGWVVACLAAPEAGPGEAEGVRMTGGVDGVLQVGGCGGVYFLAPVGELVIDVAKRDRQAERPISVRTVLFAPDRSVAADRWLPGGVQETRFTVPVGGAGVYGLMVTAADDRYGTGMTWGFRTNCARYLVETSRGHRDARHEEPIVAASPGRAGEVCFLPGRGAFRIEVAGLGAKATPLTCVDAAGTELAALVPGADGRVGHTFGAEAERRGTPWRLCLPRFEAQIQIDGVTRWTAADDYPGLSLWTPEAGSWFPFHEYRWLLTPYRRTVFGMPGSEHDVGFRVHHNGVGPAVVDLALEFPDGPSWPAALSTARIALAPRQAAEVGLHLRVPETGSTWTCRVRATCGGLSTYSTVTLVRGEAPALSAVLDPLVLKPFEHENEQFGYLPGYPLTNQPYFDPENRPVVAGGSGLRSRRGAEWVETALRGPEGTAGGSVRGTKVAFDADGDAYCLATLRGQPALMPWRRDGTPSTACPIPGSGHLDLETFSGHNLAAGPPALLRVTRTASDPKLIWRSLNDVHLLVPEKRDGGVVLGEPVLVTNRGIGISDHSGIPSALVSSGSKVHVAWGEATDPQETVPGVPTYVATFDRETRALSTPVLVGHGPPANDVHNSPCITIDSKGYLHLLVGTHGRTFRYARSLQPNDSAGGWTPAVEVGPGLSQTYVGLVCAPDDTLHLVFRLWQDHGDRFPAGSYACLAHMSKPAEGAWSAPRSLVVAPFTDYSIFYHRLTIDRKGRLFLSYDYWSTYWFYRTDHVGSRRALLLSADGGATWRLASDADLAHP